MFYGAWKVREEKNWKLVGFRLFSFKNTVFGFWKIFIMWLSIQNEHFDEILSRLRTCMGFSWSLDFENFLKIFENFSSRNFGDFFRFLANFHTHTWRRRLKVFGKIAYFWCSKVWIFSKFKIFAFFGINSATDQKNWKNVAVIHSFIIYKTDKK